MNMLLKTLFGAAAKTNLVSFDNSSNGYTFDFFGVKFLFSKVNIKYIYVNREYSELEISAVHNKRLLKVARVVKLKLAFMG